MKFNIYINFRKFARQKTHDFFEKMTNEKMMKRWFNIHNELSDLQASGLEQRRLVSLLITFDLSDFSIKNLQ